MKMSAINVLMVTAAFACCGAFTANAQDNRDVVRTKDGVIAVNSFNNCVRTKWMSDRDACAPAAKPVAKRERLTIEQEDRTVYFGFNQASLSASAKERLNTLAQTLKSEQDVKEARIIGYADRLGSAGYNERLSQKRAENVRKYIVSHGFVNARVAETRWLGESNPVTQCPDTLTRPELIECLQKDRRVEVEIDYLPEGQAQQRR